MSTNRNGVSNADAPRDGVGRFRPGAPSPNPKGRPRKARGVDAAVLGALSEKVTVTEQGKRKRKSKLEVTTAQIANQSASGDLRAAKMALDQARKAEERAEALATTPLHLDTDAKRVIFRTLKRRKTVFRAVPVPDGLMRDLAALASVLGDDDRLWPWSRQTGWRKIRALMEAAEITGPMAIPKGLRHAYGIRAAGENVPPSLIQRWLGHADPATTAIYVDALGSEERAFARKVW